MSMNQVVRAMSTMSRRPPPLRAIEDRQPLSPASKTPGGSNSGGGGTVTSVYQININGTWRNVIITWSSKNLINVSLTVRVEGESTKVDHRGETTTSSTSVGCKIELKPWHFWSWKKGSKSFEIDDRRCLEVYWDLRYAKFQGTSPEPSSDYYVCLASDDEIILILGDRKKKAYKRTKKRAAKVDPVPTMKKEVMYGKKSFTARARFAESGGGVACRSSKVLEEEAKAENEVVVENSAGKEKPPELSISVDGMMVVHVTNLQWKFRGNETVTVNKQPLQVFWDVHAWLFSGRDGRCGIFTFKPVGPAEDAPETEMEGSEGDGDQGSTSVSQKGADFCLTLHAWKVE